MDTCTPKFIAALSTIDKGWKQLKYPSSDEWMNTMWSIHTADYYLAMKRKEILIPPMTRMNLEDVMLSERSQTQKDKYCLIPLTGHPWRSHIHRDRK